MLRDFSGVGVGATGAGLAAEGCGVFSAFGASGLGVASGFAAAAVFAGVSVLCCYIVLCTILDDHRIFDAASCRFAFRRLPL